MRVIETHASRVFLAGKWAYKVLRPVHYGFLDYSSVLARHRVLEAEFRINRAFTPILYDRVLPIYGTPEAPRWEPEQAGEPPFEHALRMHRFDQADLLSAQADEGRLSAEALDEAADRLVAWQMQAPAVVPGAPWGTPADVRRWMDENFEALDRLFADPQWASKMSLESAAHFNRVRNRYASRRTAADDQFAERRAAGFVRASHGDLHLGNMVALPQGIRFFDAIAFSESLRWIDTMSELAFPVMDLADRGSRTWSWRFLNRVLSGTGDYAGLAVLPDYLTYRALVRAKVLGLRSAEGDAASVQHLLRYADGVVPTGPQRLELTHGVSGSGKSTGAMRISENEGMIWLRSDVERKRLFGLSAETRADAAVGEGLYSPEATSRTQAHLLDLVETVLQAGFSVIVDATFLQRADRAPYQALAARMNAVYTVRVFDAPEGVLRQRIARRRAVGTDPSDATEEVLAAQLRRVEPPHAPAEPWRPG
jgi:aminoglycoside phosphotransferase family enzyme/predicted kinase